MRRYRKKGPRISDEGQKMRDKLKTASLLNKAKPIGDPKLQHTYYDMQKGGGKVDGKKKKDA